MNLTMVFGVNVVYDGVGKDTALESLRMFISFRYVSYIWKFFWKCSSIDPSLLASKGSLFLTRPSLMTYNADIAI